MRVAVLSDVHGNVEALRAVLADVRAAEVDRVVVCGDLTWGPEPAEVAGMVRDLPRPASSPTGSGRRQAIVET
jgi:3',5'-cyclic AMP phosphodiesterase CpdA